MALAARYEGLRGIKIVFASIEVVMTFLFKKYPLFRGILATKMKSFQRRLLLSMLVVTATINPSIGEGINCHGSSDCHDSSWAPARNVSTKITIYINSTADTRTYNAYQRIACSTWFDPDGPSGTVCAFVQNIQGMVNGSLVKKVANDIPKHGCLICGNVPLRYPASNDVSQGQLTYNIVDHPVCKEGVC